MPVIQSFQQGQMEPWLRDILKSLAERSEAVRREPYIPYPGERQEPFHPDMLRAFELARVTGDYQPFLDLAQKNLDRGSQEFPEAAERYMNPYQKQVIDNLIHHAGRGLKEEFLPALEGHFVGLGQHGSTKHQELAARATRNAQEALNRQISDELSRGYQTSGILFNADQKRALEAAEISPNLSLAKQAGRLADISALGNIGAAQQAQGQQGRNLAYEEWARQRDYPQHALANQAATLQGIPYSQSFYKSEITPGAPQADTAANIGSIATQLAGAYRGRERKSGGKVKKFNKGGLNALYKNDNIKEHPFTQTSFVKSPKVGGVYAMTKHGRI